MKAVSKKAAKVLDTLTAGLEKPGDHRKIHNNQSFMYVAVEHIGFASFGDFVIPRFSVAHYYELNGDLMRDPEMVFVRSAGGYFPTYYRQDNMGIEQTSLWHDDDGTWMIRAAMQRDHANFATDWMMNIAEQQGLEVQS